MEKEFNNKIGSEAILPNPNLKIFVKLIGVWKTKGYHQMIPEKTLHGRTSFEWIEGGAFLLMRSEIDEPEIPSAIAIVGTDNKQEGCYMLYFDERGISRKYEVALEENLWKWWRNEPNFSQRFTGTIIENGTKIIGKGEICRDNKTWEQDLNLDYSLIE